VISVYFVWCLSFGLSEESSVVVVDGFGRSLEATVNFLEKIRIVSLGSEIPQSTENPTNSFWMDLK
jgi:hypothetical protein